MREYHLTLMEKSDIPEAVEVLSFAMLDNPLHVAIFQGKGEKERLEIEKMFFNLFNELPGIIFLAKEKGKIIGTMRMKSCEGSKALESPKGAQDENDIDWRKSVWQAEWTRRDPSSLHWHLGPIGVLPSHQGSGVGSALMERFLRRRWMLAKGKHTWKRIWIKTYGSMKNSGSSLLPSPMYWGS